MKAKNPSRRGVLQAALASVLGGLFGAPRKASAQPARSVRLASYDVERQASRTANTYRYDAAGRRTTFQQALPPSVLREVF